MLNRIRICADVVVLAGFAIGAYICLRSIGSPTYWFPTFVTVSGSLAAAYLLVSDSLRLRAGESLVSGEVTDVGASVSDTHDSGSNGASSQDAEGNDNVRTRVLAWSLWLVSLPLLALVVPFFYASLAWLVAVLLFQTKSSFRFVIPAVVGFGVCLNAIVLLLDIGLPPALLSGLG